MKKTTLFLLLITLLSLSACTSQNQPRVNPEIDSANTSEEAETVSSPTREPVFVYGDSKSALGNRIELTLNGEPLLFPSGYVRLVGVVSGGRPIACLEVGGRGLALGMGDNVGEYRLINVGRDKAVLKRLR